jgi:hypothetical protein
MKRCLLVLATTFLTAFVQREAQAQYPDLAGFPFTNTYENLAVGDSILTNPAAGCWTGTNDATAYVTNVKYTAKASSALPDVSHDNIVVFSTEGGEIKNTFDTNAFFTSHMFVDTMIQPVFSEELPRNAAVTNSQLSVAFDTNGFINIFHGVVTDDPLNWSALATNQWSAFPIEQVSSGQWVRLSVELFYNMDDNNRAIFKAQINGTTCSNEYSFYAYNPEKAAMDGPWFRCATDYLMQLREIALSGTGSLDDLLVSTNEPVVARVPTITIPPPSGAGSVTPSGPVVYLTGGATETNFSLECPYYSYISLATNGAPIAEASSTNLFAFTWSNITGDNTLEVNFVVRTAGNGIPYEWLANHGLGTNGWNAADWDANAAGDADRDGMSTFNEYVAGTDPMNPASLLKIINQTVTAGVPVVTWLSSTETLHGAPYLLQTSSNLVDQANWSTFQTVPATVVGTNSVMAPIPEATPAFYRVRLDTTVP